MLCPHPWKCRAHFHVPSLLGMAPAVQTAFLLLLFYSVSNHITKASCLFRLTSLSPGGSFWPGWLEAQMINLIWLRWLSKYLFTLVSQKKKAKISVQKKGGKFSLTVSQHLVTSGEKGAFERQHPSAYQVFMGQFPMIWHFMCYLNHLSEEPNIQLSWVCTQRSKDYFLPHA